MTERVTERSEPWILLNQVRLISPDGVELAMATPVECVCGVTHPRLLLWTHPRLRDLPPSAQSGDMPTHIYKCPTDGQLHLLCLMVDA